jgi:hypothetical protein
MDWQRHWDRETPGPVDSNILVDVNPQEALPHRDVSTERPHLPGAKVTLYDSPVKDEIAQLTHLYALRTHSELFFETDVEITVAAWQNLARTHDRLLYDCHHCKVTWPVTEDAETCPVGHMIEG